MAYQSLYRKYRPQTFADVVGQGHVVRTLQNALSSGRVAHGYLFTGTRGTAKTTVARLLAKALNCESSDRPVAEPCNACPACKAVTAGGSVDVVELDAASHRGVADIEEIRKSVGYGPMELRYKVFIIDEAHQLSSDAKDAFLKTLEEPPDNVVFVLATTEPQAIPITIRSRCQQFDFKRGSLLDITNRLRYVLGCEGVDFAPEAVTLVARAAEGSYRDSLSLLEQVLAYTPTRISTGDVETVLGTLDSEMLARLMDTVASRDAAGALALSGEILDSGKEARTLLKSLAAHCRDLLLVSVGGPAVAAELSPDEVMRLQAQASRFTPAQLLSAIDTINEAHGETRWNNQHRLLVDLTLLKLMDPPGATAAPFATAPIVFNAPAVPAIPVSVPTVSAPATAAPVAAADTIATKPPRAKAAPPVIEPPTVEAAVVEVAKSEPTPPEVEASPTPTSAPIVDETVDDSGAMDAGYFAGDDETDDEDDYIPDAIVSGEDVLPDTEDGPGMSGPSLFDDYPAPAREPAPGSELSLFDEPANAPAAGSLFDDAPAPAAPSKPSPPTQTAAPVAPPATPATVTPATVTPATRKTDQNKPAPVDATPELELSASGSAAPEVLGDAVSAAEVADAPTPAVAEPSPIAMEEIAAPVATDAGEASVGVFAAVVDVDADVGDTEIDDTGFFSDDDAPPVDPLADVAPPRVSETPRPAPKPVAIARAPEPIVEEPPVPAFTLEQVRQIWPMFLNDAAKFSKRASVFLGSAMPVAVDGRTIVIHFGSHSNLEMMSQPRQLDFIKRLLARCLGFDGEDASVPVRLALADGVAPPPPVHRKTARQKVRHDPLAALDAARRAPREEPAEQTAAAPWSPPSWSTPAAPQAYTPQAYAPQPTAPTRTPDVSEPSRGASRVSEQSVPGGFGRDNTSANDAFARASAPPQESATNAAKASSKRQAAMDDPFLGEILSTFGGSIVDA